MKSNKVNKNKTDYHNKLYNVIKQNNIQKYRIKWKSHVKNVIQRKSIVQYRTGQNKINLNCVVHFNTV